MEKNKDKKILKIECDKCHKLFEESDMDIIDGDWICRKCEEEI